VTDGTINLGAARAARREGRSTEIRVTLEEGADPVVLPVELPVDALAPLKAIELHSDLGLLARVQNARDGEQMVRDLIAVRPALAGELLDAGKGCLERLFCSRIEPDEEKGGCDLEPVDETGKPLKPKHDPDCQYLRFLGWLPSAQDYVELIKGLWQQYGASLGEALAPSGSSGTGGATSRPTSPGSTRRSTRGASTRTPAKAR
jgi:hypothetical protein